MKLPSNQLYDCVENRKAEDFIYINVKGEPYGRTNDSNEDRFIVFDNFVVSICVWIYIKTGKQKRQSTSRYFRNKTKSENLYGSLRTYTKSK